MTPRDHLLLKILVFVSGAVLMSLEIVGSRFLAPYYGNSVYVWGSLIGVFLAALSLGYYIGGVFADRNPSFALLNGLLIAAAALILLLRLGGERVCAEVASVPGLGEDERWRALIASAILFFLPSVILGMVSPFAIRLAARDLKAIGNLAGRLYALSTAGSILGTMGTTFFLIPSMGTKRILLLQAIGLVAPAVLFLFAGRRGRPALGVLLLLSAGLALLPPAGRRAGVLEEVLREAETPYHHILVIDNKGHREGPRRELKFSQFVESSIWLPDKDRPDDKAWLHETASDYPVLFHVGGLFLPPERFERFFERRPPGPGAADGPRVLFIGAGGGVGPRAFLRRYPGLQVDVVDIDGKVIELAHEFFFLEKGPRLRTEVADGRMFIRRARAPYDLVFLDAFTAGGRIPFHLITREYFEEIRRALRPGGALVMNVISALRPPPVSCPRCGRAVPEDGRCALCGAPGRRGVDRSGTYRWTLAAFRKAFPQVYVFPNHGDPDVKHSVNVILVGSNEKRRPTRAEILAAGAALDRRLDPPVLQFDEVPGYLHEEDRDLAEIPGFTDDYAPVETMDW